MSPENRKWDLETDLLVIGAGAAGMTAALVGALEGLKTILCEKSDMVGGTTATSAGTVWIPGSRQSKAPACLTPSRPQKPILRRYSARTPMTRGSPPISPPGPPCSIISRREPAWFRAAAGSSRLSRAAGRRDRRPGARRDAIRRPQARRGFCTGAPAAPRVHGARRHDGRQDRYSVAAAPVPLLGNFANAAACWRGRRWTGSITARHAPDHGQRAGRAAARQPEAKRGRDSLPDPAQRADRGRRRDHRRASSRQTMATSPFARERAWCWRPAASAGAANCATGCFRKGRSVIRCRPTATPATAFSPPNARAARSRRTAGARRCGCRVR